MNNGSSAKKLTLITATLLAVGNIIGSGILGTLPAAVSVAGSKTFIGILVAAVNVFFTYFVLMIVCGVIPANAGPYMYMTRLVHPWMVVFDMIERLKYFFLIALMGSIFSGYFTTLFPGVNGKAASIVIILIFGLLNLYGIDAAAKVGNILVVLLFISFMLFSFYGLTVDLSTIPDYVPDTGRTLNFATIGTVSALFATTLGGGQIVGEIADQLENPGKNIMRAFTLAISIVVVIYSLMSFATARVAGGATFDTLSTIAKLVMPTGAFYLFMIGGAMAAILTTINALIISTTAYLNRYAQDKVLPEAFGKKNSRGINTLNIMMTIVIPIIILLTNIHIGTLLAVCAVLVVFTALVKIIPALLIEKKYPNAYRKANLHPAYSLIVVFVIIAAALNLYSGVSTIISTPGRIWGILLALVVSFAVYFFARRAYLKSKGVDLDAELRTVPESWTEAENS
ncbi:MAG: amino acid permease [Mogibacterium sp.]|nr:amino acid permease [Mogibacterium sp.]